MEQNEPLRQVIRDVAQREQITAAQVSLAWVYEQARQYQVAVSPDPGYALH